MYALMFYCDLYLRFLRQYYQRTQSHHSHTELPTELLISKMGKFVIMGLMIYKLYVLATLIYVYHYLEIVIFGVIFQKDLCW